MADYEALAKDDEPNPITAAMKDTRKQAGGVLGGKNKKNQWYEQNTKLEKFTDVQVRRAAWLTHRFLLFRRKLERCVGVVSIPDLWLLIHIQSLSGKIYCQIALDLGHLICINTRGEVTPHLLSDLESAELHSHRLFGVCRIPQAGCDKFNNPDPSARHITVLIDDKVYSVDVLDTAGEPLIPAAIEARLWEAVKDAVGRNAVEKVGLLSGDDRDKWTEVRLFIFSMH